MVRALLAAECPAWSDRPLTYLRTSGTSNAMWRVRLDGQADLVVRLPRRPEAAAEMAREAMLLRWVAQSSVAAEVTTPTVRHLGAPNELAPHAWLVLEWIDGVDAWEQRHRLAAHGLGPLAVDLGRLVTAIGALPVEELLPHRAPGSRGGPLAPVLDRLRRWLDDPAWNAAELLDVDAVRRLADRAAEVADDPTPTAVVHGDLIPGNLLVADGRLTAVIDWAGVGVGDPAQDLAPAWSVTDDADRPAFRDTVGVDDATWLRGRAIELEHAVGGVLYYAPRGHALGDLMARTLERVLADD